jgi:hypothetical protein
VRQVVFVFGGPVKSNWKKEESKLTYICVCLSSIDACLNDFCTVDNLFYSGVNEIVNRFITR